MIKGVDDSVSDQTFSWQDVDKIDYRISRPIMQKVNETSQLGFCLMQILIMNAIVLFRNKFGIFIE